MSNIHGIVGQIRPVKVVKLVVKETVEEHMYRCAGQKLRLDQSLSNSSADDRTSSSENGVGKQVAANEDVDVSTVLRVLRAELNDA